MSTKPLNDLTDHEYDGIREYDNPTPGWWTWIFVVTIVFCFPYFLMYHFGNWGWDVHEAHTRAVADDLKRQFGEIGDLNADEATMQRFMNDEKWLPVGEVVFRANCVQCHGAEGAGRDGGGVNLTDEKYKNIKQLADIPNVVANGAANGGMPAWRTRLHRNEIVLVSCYVARMRGRNLPGRSPEGETIAPWPKPPATSAPSAAGK